MSEPAVGIGYRFGDFILDVERRLLSRLDGTPLPLPAAAIDTLVYLVERAGELVDKDSLARAIWPHVNVVENNLAQSISALRRALDELPSDHRFIVTVPGRGYRFVAKVAAASPRVELQRQPTDDTLAYQAYVTGWSALTRPGSHSLKVALRAFNEAVSRDPGFALAYTRLSHCYTLLGLFGIEAPHEVFPKAHAAILKALDLDEQLGEAHAHHAQILMLYYFDDEGAERALQRAMQINPQSSLVHHYVGLRLCGKGHIDDALAAVRRAQAIEPLAPIFSANIGMIYYYGKRYNEAVQQLQSTLAMDSSLDHARSVLGRTYLRLGNTRKAIEQFERRRAITIGSVADLPAAHALSGSREEAIAGLRRLLNAARKRHVSPYDIATIYAAMNDAPKALDWLERAVDLRDPTLPLLPIDPALDPLRSQLRFRNLVAALSRGDLLLCRPAN
jgi:DNA-binding winged helix-turn-helix (wHTH) protein